MAAKMLISVLTFFTITTAQAFQTETIDIAPNDYQVSDLCPQGVVCFTDGTQISLDYEWPCDTEVLKFSYEVEQIDNEIHVYLQTIIRYASTEVTCQGLVREVKLIALPNRYGDVILHSKTQEQFATM